MLDDEILLGGDLMKQRYILLTCAVLYVAFYSSITQAMEQFSPIRDLTTLSPRIIGSSIVRPNVSGPRQQPLPRRPHSANGSFRPQILPDSGDGQSTSQTQDDSGQGERFHSICALTLGAKDEPEVSSPNDDIKDREMDALDLAEGNPGEHSFTHQSCTILARFDVADTAEGGFRELCTGTIFDSSIQEETYVFEFAPPPQTSENPTDFVQLGHLTPNRCINLDGIRIAGLQTRQQLSIMYCPSESVFALAQLGMEPKEKKELEDDERAEEAQMYTAQTPHINTAPSLAALLDLLPELLNKLLLTEPGTPEGIYFGEDGRLYDEDGGSIATS